MSEITAEMIARKQDAEAGAQERRRRLQRGMKEARERLTSNTGLNRTFTYELARQFAQNRLNSSAAVAIFATMTAVALGRWIIVPHLVFWVIGVFSMLALMAIVCRQFLEADPETVKLSRWRLRFITVECLSCCSWALLAALSIGNNDETLRTMLALAMVLAGAVGTMLSATIPAATYAGLAPIMAGIITLLRPGLNIGGGVVALSAAGAVYLFVILARKLHASAIEMMEYRVEKDILIVELEQQRAKSDESRLRAEEANLAKSRFLATMSHELRTPLNAILGFSEVMKDEVFGPLAHPSYKEYATDIHASGEHLLNLINEILDLSRIEAGRYELQEESIDLVDVVDTCVHMIEIRAQGREQRLRTVFQEKLPRLWADERALRQIALNLLSNAIKFTPTGGEITVKVGWTKSGGQYLSIRDTGPGMPENEIPTVLSSFGRGASAIKAAQEGTGLGLPIVKNLIDLHGGGFQLKSKVREGTEVIVTIPPQRVMEALAAVPAHPVPEKFSLKRKAA